jgi:hypothetical protein
MKIYLEYLENKLESINELKRDINFFSNIDCLNAKEEEIKKLKTIIDNKESLIKELKNKFCHIEENKKSSQNSQKVNTNKSRKSNVRSLSMLHDYYKSKFYLNKVINTFLLINLKDKHL